MIPDLSSCADKTYGDTTPAVVRATLDRDDYPPGRFMDTAPCAGVIRLDAVCSGCRARLPAAATQTR